MSTPVKVPSVGESVTEVTIAGWVKGDGDHVEMDEVICEVESDKATVELAAESSGVLKILVQEGETVPIGHIIAELTEGTGATKALPASKKEESSPATSGPAQSAPPSQLSPAAGHPSPAAQKIMNENNISPGQVNASGPGGRITKQDLGNMPAQKTSAPSLQVATSLASGGEIIRREKMSRLRQTIAKRLVEVKNTTAMLTTFNEVDMSMVMSIRKKYKDAFKEKHDISLGFMSFFTKAVSLSLKEFPAVGCIIDGTDMLFSQVQDVGIAVSTPKGLVVPIIKNAGSMTLFGIEREVMRLALKARDGKISMDDMTGGQFTITNGGIFGSMLSTPILNPPQSAILGMHNIVQRPVAIDGQVVIRPIMYLALSYDHRVVDGRESVGFLKKIKEMIEDPTRLLLEV